MRTHASIPLGEFAGQNLTNPFRGASQAARACDPKGYGWVPKFPHRQTREEKVALYRSKREAGRLSDESWAAICQNFPEAAR